MKKKLITLAAAFALNASASDFNYSTNEFGVVTLDSYIQDSFQTNRVVTVPDGVNVIGSSAFCNRINIELIHLPDSVTEIELAAFYGLYKLRHVRMSPNTQRIGDLAFWACSGLQALNYNPKETETGVNTFEYCYSLKPWTPWLEYYRDGSSFVIIYEGTLQTSTDLETWTDVPDTSGLYKVTPTDKPKFLKTKMD